MMLDPMRRWKRYTTDEDAILRDMRSRFCTLAQIAARLGRNCQSVANRLGTLKIRLFPPVDWPALLARPHTYEELAETTGREVRSIKNIKQLLAARGVPVYKIAAGRPRKERVT